MTELAVGLLDTSVLIDYDVIDVADLPDDSAISAITIAELAAGPHTTDDPGERSRRQDRLIWASTTFDPLPFDEDAARAYGRVVAAIRAAGRRERRRLADLLIAATAVSTGLALVTRNPEDLVGLADVLDIRRV